MDLQNILDNAMVARRNEVLKSSPQLTLGELILKLEAIDEKGREVVFDFGDFRPTGLSSWRGIYAELALSFDGETSYSVEALLDELKLAVGKEYTGYKGGEFVMGRLTPIWVANYGETSVKNYKGADDEAYDSVGVVDVQDGEKVTLITAICKS